jgi:hypothetical protein
VIGADDAVYLEVLETHSTLYLACSDPGASQQDLFQSLGLMRIAPDGSTSTTPLFEFFQSHTTPDYEGWYDLTWPTIGRVTPDGRGGVVATWQLSSQDVHYTTPNIDYTGQQRFSRVVGNTVSEYSWPTEPALISYQVSLSTIDGRLYIEKGMPFSNDFTLTALAVETFEPVWTRASDAKPIVPLDHNKVMIQSSDGPIETVDAEGTTIGSVTTSLTDVRSLLGGQSALHGRNASTGAIVELSVDAFCDAEFSFLAQEGKPQKQNAPINCGNRPPFATVRKGLVPGRVYYYQFLGTAWTTDQRDGIREAFQKWSDANRESGLNTVFEPADAEHVATISLQKTVIISEDPFHPTGGYTFADPAGDGTIKGGLVQFSDNIRAIYSKEGYLKTALHEIGHLLGLADNNGSNGTSVMNLLAGNLERSASADDPNRNIPTEVQPCDRQRAKLAAETPWPRP